MSNQKSTHFHWVDIIKGTAIIGVVLSHREQPVKDNPVIPQASLME